LQVLYVNINSIAGTLKINKLQLSRKTDEWIYKK